MNQVYVIRSLSLGYWCDARNEFRGWRYATKYNSFSSALIDVKNASKTEPCEIVMIYL